MVLSVLTRHIHSQPDAQHKPHVPAKRKTHRLYDTGPCLRGIFTKRLISAEVHRSHQNVNYVTNPAHGTTTELVPTLLCLPRIWVIVFAQGRANETDKALGGRRRIPVNVSIEKMRFRQQTLHCRERNPVVEIGSAMQVTSTLNLR